MGLIIITVIAFVAGLTESKILKKDSDKKEKRNCLLQTMLLSESISLLAVRLAPPIKHFLNSEKYTVKQYVLVVLIAAVISAVTCLVYGFAEKHNSYEENKTADKKGFFVLRIVSSVLFFLGLGLFLGVVFINNEWSQTRPEQLIINMLSPTTGTELGIYFHGFEFVILAFCWGGLFAVANFKKFSFSVKSKQFFSDSVKSVISIVLAISLLVCSCGLAEKLLHISVLYNAYTVKSDFIEDNFVDAKDVKITFPEKKRNVIYFYLESIENTYLSKDLGGYMEENLMPELTELSKEGITFSDTERKFGGPNQIFGTSWSLASMVNQNLGVTMNPTTVKNPYTEDNFYKGTYGFGDILKEQGYNQEIMIGSDAGFGALDNLYKLHGDYKIFDYNYAKDNGYIPSDYKVWWGYEDDKLYEFAKQEITRLSKEDKPFNFTLEDADTHMPDGYLPKDAPRPYDSPYANAIANSTKHVVEFIRWIQQQPFYENTTIIMIGDHLSMDVKFFKNMDKSYKRTQYNLILNPAESVMSTDSSRFINRQYANYDMLPTVLASMGCEIEGDRLSLGTNLFSDKKTIMEEYGVEKVDSEMSKASDYYNNNIMQ